jgi:hypothetical protein
MTTEKKMILDGNIFREYTEEEYAQNAKDIADALAIKAEEDALMASAQAKRQAALAKLEALGLEEDDLKALGL